MAVLVKEVMIKDIVTINEKATIGDAVEMFAEKKIGCLPVVDDNGNLVAFLSDGDIVYYVAGNLRLMQTQSKAYAGRLFPDPKCTNYFTLLLKNCVDHNVLEAATHHVVTVDAYQSVRRAAELMQKKHLKQAPVLEEGKLVGLITRNDIIHGLFNDYLANPDAPCIEGADDDF
ncbi:MAG: CBS domain-containing protein [Peptococcaceae bacterium]|nr:CBS domain-containing protein [Peptococcaceae bacterium]